MTFNKKVKRWMGLVSCATSVEEKMNQNKWVVFHPWRNIITFNADIATSPLLNKHYVDDNLK